MADNVELSAGSGGDTIAADDDGTAKHQYVKVEFGADDTQTPVDSSNPLPVEIFDTSGASLVKSEDATHNTGDPGVQILAVRNDTLAALAGTDGDYAPLQVNASGALFVEVDSFVPGTGATSLGKAEDAAHTTGDTGVQVLAVRNDELAALAGTDGDYAPLQVSAAGALITTGASAAVVNSQVIAASTSGNNTLLAAQGAGNKIRVHSLFFMANGTVTVRFESGADGTALTGQMDYVAQTGMVLPHNDHGWFETAANALLNLELSGAVEVAGGFTYSVVT